MATTLMPCLRSVLRADARITSQIGCNGVVPLRQRLALSETEGRDQLRVWFQTCWILFAVQISGHNQAGLGAGGANEFKHLFVAIQWLGSPVFGNLGEQTM